MLRMNRPFLRLLASAIVIFLLGLSIGCGKDEVVDPPADPLDPTQPAPDFSILDVNPNSSTSSQPVSPRNYATNVSAWYFGHAT